MRRVFWMAVGAAAGIWAYQRGAEALERARARGMVGNVVAVSTLAGRLAAASARLVLVASEQGAALAERLSTVSSRPPSAPAAASDPAGRRLATAPSTHPGTTAQPPARTYERAGT